MNENRPGDATDFPGSKRGCRGWTVIATRCRVAGTVTQRGLDGRGRPPKIGAHSAPRTGAAEREPARRLEMDVLTGSDPLPCLINEDGDTDVRDEPKRPPARRRARLRRQAGERLRDKERVGQSPTLCRQNPGQQETGRCPAGRLILPLAKDRATA